MKKKVFIGIFLLFSLFYVLLNIDINKTSYSANNAEDALRIRYQNAVLETANQYLYRGKNIQYDSTLLTYEKGKKLKKNGQIGFTPDVTDHPEQSRMNQNALYSPEDVTDQDIHLFVCSHFTTAVYSETFVDNSGNKYVFKNKKGFVRFDVGDLNAMANKNKEETYRKDIAVYQVRDNNDYKWSEHKSEIYKIFSDVDNGGKLKPGDLIVYGNGSSGHVMLYVGNDRVIHSTTGAPKTYRDAGNETNTAGIPGAKYHLESKADIIETESGTLEVATDTKGTVKKTIWSSILDNYYAAANNGKVMSILRPINELVKNSNYKLSNNAVNREKKPGLYLIKKASVEKYESVNLGDSITYSIIIENKSENNYTNIEVKDVVPEYTTLTKINNSGKNNNGNLSWTVNLNAGKKITLTYTVTLSKYIGNLGKTIESNKGTVNGIPLKSISTKINITLTKDEISNLVNYVKNNNNKTYSRTVDFINDAYENGAKLKVNLKSFNDIYNNLFVKGTYTVSSEDNKNFVLRTLEPEGAVRDTYTLKKRENVSSEYQDYYDTYVSGLFGGIYTSSQDETVIEHSRNVIFTSKTLLPGDVIYVYDANYAKDSFNNYPNKGGYITGEKNMYLYLGDGEFATMNIKTSKVYIYDKNKEFNYYFYTPTRDKEYKIDFTGLRKVSMGERLLISLIGQNSFIVLRPSYNIEYPPTNVSVTSDLTKKTYIQKYEKLDLTGGKVRIFYGRFGTQTLDITNKNITVSNFDNTKVGTNTLKITYKDPRTSKEVSTTYDVQIINKSLESISVSSNPKKIDYVQNKEQLDLNGGVLKLTYNDKSTGTLDMTNKDVKVSGFDNTKLGKQKITLTYNNKKTTISVSIVEKAMSDVKLEKKPTKAKYIENYEELDLTGGVIKVIYSDNSVDTIDLPNKEVKVSGFNNKKNGSNTISLTYLGKTITFNVSIVSKSIESIEMDKLPNKTKYIQNKEQLDITTGSMKVSYNNKTKETIKLSSPNVTVSGFNNSTLGTQKITVTYLKKETSFNVEIIKASERKLVSVKVHKKPNKTKYTKGVEVLDLSGGQLELKYDDNTTEIINMNSVNVEVGSFDNNSTGKQKVELNYFGQKVELDVDVVEREITKIEVKETPQKEEYTESDDKLDLSGGYVEVNYSDKTKEKVELTSPNIKVVETKDVVETIQDETTQGESKTNSSAKKKKKVVIAYGGQQSSFDVKVDDGVTLKIDDNTPEDNNENISELNNTTKNDEINTNEENMNTNKPNYVYIIAGVLVVIGGIFVVIKKFLNKKENISYQ